MVRVLHEQRLNEFWQWVDHGHCLLVADTREELEEAAAELGLDPAAKRWWPEESYPLTFEESMAALRAGLGDDRVARAREAEAAAGIEWVARARRQARNGEAALAGLRPRENDWRLHPAEHERRTA